LTEEESLKRKGSIRFDLTMTETKTSEMLKSNSNQTKKKESNKKPEGQSKSNKTSVEHKSNDADKKSHFVPPSSDNGKVIGMRENY
jgi:hypothetical protein